MRIGGHYSVGGDVSMRVPRDVQEFSDISSDGGDVTTDDAETSGKIP